MIILSFSAKQPAQIVRQIEQNLFAEVPKVGRLKLRNFLMRIQNRMKGVGKKSTRPVRWDTDRQRKAFFASDGFGRGIPTKRTNEYIRGWSIVQKTNGFALTNKSASAKFIGGDAYGLGQSKIHRGRWVLLRDVTDAELDKLPAEMRNALFVVARRVVKETPA